MTDAHFDVAIVGAGPAGSTAALVLARAGMRVALVDKAVFPRDKACGDLVGPRGVQVLGDLGVSVPGTLEVSDMRVIGPSRRSVRLPAFPGISYPGYALAVPRRVLDTALRDAAVAAGAEPHVGHVVEVLQEAGGINGVALADGRRLRADAVIGADGATSRVAQAAGLLDNQRVMWAFAVRTYLTQSVDLPTIVFWEHARWQALPGYGWLFPGPAGQANAGLGVGTLADRTIASRATQLLPMFLGHLHDLGLLQDRTPARRLGGWLKMGMVGTRPAGGRVLLVGDAAGLVNPLQGEGIAQAMRSGQAAAVAVINAGGCPERAGHAYRAWLAREHLPYQGIAAAAQAALVRHPRAVAALGRALTFPGVAGSIAPGWSVFWNELLEGATPGRGAAIAAAVTRVGGIVTSPTPTWKWLRASLAPGR